MNQQWNATKKNTILSFINKDLQYLDPKSTQARAGHFCLSPSAGVQDL